MAPGPQPVPVDPLTPFTGKDTALALVLWPVAAANMIFWLVVMTLLHHTVMPGRRMDRLVRFVNRLVTTLAGVRVRQHGLDQLAQHQGPFVFCLNHTSMLDAPVFVQSIPYFTRAFQDVRHFRIPVYGGFCRILGQLPVQRGNSELNERSHAEALERLREGSCFAVFPEGHRSRDGRLAEFYAGAFRVAIEAQVPVVPVVTLGLRNLCPPSEWRFRPGRVEVVFGEPIPTEGMSEEDQQQLAQATREAMLELLLRGV